MVLAIATICESIAALDVEGVKMRDLDEIPEEVLARECPVIFPRPDGFISSFAVERDSFGGGSTAKMTATYVLTYRFLQAPVASGRGLFEVYNKMVINAFAFLDAVIAVDVMSGLIDIQVNNTLNFGPVSDPAGNIFHGCDIELQVMEFIN